MNFVNLEIDQITNRRGFSPEECFLNKMKPYLSLCPKGTSYPWLSLVVEMATMDLTGEVVRLRAELEKVSAERDMLLCEVSNLRRELELSELKQLQDDR
ncbi:unnamed protein product [Arctia plantaginis]|uniref:Uncharacterized protein n=1 Tax=Arctia plantaginis TaxID=874455 RepID=A0A8S0ZK46_ARCPL|nr:unnamed protein product [Arctia plantaginis]